MNSIKQDPEKSVSMAKKNSLSKKKKDRHLQDRMRRASLLCILNIGLPTFM
jgi:hypothetical protein